MKCTSLNHVSAYHGHFFLFWLAFELVYFNTIYHCHLPKLKKSVIVAEVRHMRNLIAQTKKRLVIGVEWLDT